MADDPWSAFPDAGGAAVADDPFAHFPDAEQAAQPVASNQPTPTALPAPPAGSYPSDPNKTGLSGALNEILGLPYKAVVGTTNAALGTVTGDIFQNPDSYQPTEADAAVPLATGKTMADVLAAPLGGLPSDEAIKKTGGIQGDLSGAVKGLLQGAGNQASAFTSGGNLAALPFLGPVAEGKVAQRAIEGIFEAQAVGGIKDQWKALREAKTISEKTRIGTEMAISLLAPIAPELAPLLRDRAGTTPEEVTTNERQSQAQGQEQAQTQDGVLAPEATSVQPAAEPVNAAAQSETATTPPSLAPTVESRGIPSTEPASSMLPQTQPDMGQAPAPPDQAANAADIPPAERPPTEANTTAPEKATTISEIGLSSKDLTDVPQNERAQYLVARGELAGSSHQKLSGEVGSDAFDAFASDSGRTTGPQHNVFVTSDGQILTRAEMEKTGLPTHSQELQKANEAVASPAGPNGESTRAGETLGAGNGSAESTQIAADVAESVRESSNGESSGTGIAQRVNEARTEAGRTGEILPGEGVSAEDMVQRGRELLKGGADPEAIIAGVAEGKAVTGDEMAVLRARREELSRVTDAADDALRKNPYDTTLKQARDDAFNAETEFAQRIKPAATEWHKVGQSMQGETDVETGSFTGLRRAFQERTGRDVTPTEAVTLEKTAEKVQKADAAVEKTKSDFSEVVKKETKGRKVKTADELRDQFAEKFKKMLLCD